MLGANSVNNFNHPRLSAVPLLGTLLHNCLYQRGCGRGNSQGSEPDDMFAALLGARPPSTPARALILWCHA